MSAEQQDDDDLFRRTMAELGVKQSRSPSNKQSPVQRPASTPKRRGPEDRVRAPGSPPAPPAIDLTDQRNAVLFVRSGVTSARVKQLRRGQVPLQESLDLHGMRSSEAEAAMERYLTECLNLRLQCVLLIHGKGYGSEVTGGVLKPLALHWLKQQPEVLAFCEALPEDGGSGALYLLLDTGQA